MQRNLILIDLVKSFPDAEEHCKNDDGNERKDDATDRLGHHAAMVGDAVSTQKEPKHGYRKKEASRAAPGRCQKASSGDWGTQKTKKARVAPKEK